MENLKFKSGEQSTIKLIENINQLRDTIKSEKVNFLLEELEKKLSDLKKKINLEIAFVGQYSAGKSTIISAISGNKNIKIGQDITTDIPQPYTWGNVILVDTPGIYAGRPDHDTASIEYMNKADLLVYTITTQGFTAETAFNFKHLAFEENRIDKIMLVINKSSQGNKELSETNWISDALMVTEPKTANDLFLSVIDAKDYVEAFDFENDTDKKEMIAYSGFEQFIGNLNSFIVQKGILGRLITPINLAQEYLNRIIDELTSRNEDTKNMLELLNRKVFRLKKSEKEVTEIANGLINNLNSKIKEEGNRIASLIEKDGDSEILKIESENSIEKLKGFSDDTSKKIEQIIESELIQLQNELEILMQSELAQVLLNQETIDLKFNKEINLNSVDKERIKSGIDILNNFSNFVKGFTLNAKAAEAGAKGLRAVSGSEAHKVIYSVGKFFGHKFKPYGAVKLAGKFGKVGAIIGKVTVALPFLAAGFEEWQERKYEKKIKEERQKVRESYDDIASNIKSTFHGQFDNFLKESYQLEIANTNKIIEGIRDADKIKDKEVLKIQEILDKSTEILSRLN